jgi:S1-C subfamily serine protease
LGTGFFVTDDGYFLTCCHVIRGASHISIRSGQARYQAALVRADSQNDLALLKVSGTFRSLPVAPPASVKLGDPVFTIGFPNPDLQGFEPKLTKGDVSSLAGGRDNPLYFQISVPVQLGNSGGALVNTVGNVVGIVSDRLSDSAALETTGMLAQNVNYAVKCDSVTAFLGALPEVLAKLKSPYRSKDRKSEDVLKEAQDATALVIASHLGPGGSSLAAMGNGHAAGALPVELRINGLSGGPGHRLVTINNNTFAAGEEGDVISNGDRVRIRCLEIKDNAAVVQIGKEQQTLNLP